MQINSSNIAKRALNKLCALYIFRISNKRFNFSGLDFLRRSFRYEGVGKIVISPVAKLGRYVSLTVAGQLNINNGVVISDFFRVEDIGENNTIEILRNSTLGVYSRISMMGKNSILKIAENVYCRGSLNIVVDNGGLLEIAPNSFINNNCSFNCQEEVKIGEHCFFGENVKIYDHNHIYGLEHEGFVTDKFNAAKISIGKNCWIGSNVTILKGVTIGDNVVVGANCLIYQSIPSNSVVKAQTNIIINPVIQK